MSARGCFRLTKSLPETIPASMEAVKTTLLKAKFGSALKKAEGVAGRLEGDEKTQGDALVAWIQARAKEGMDKAAKSVEEGRVYEGMLAYESVEDLFKGHALAKEAKDAVKALKKDKAHALEIKASEKLIKIKATIAEERKAEDKLAALKPLLSKKYADTYAGAQAAKMASELEGQIER